jgi:N-acyl homoserine lactone hydrolase
MPVLRSLSLLSMSLWLAVGAVRADDSATAIRLYALDCGHIEFKDLGLFSDTGEYAGQPGTIADPCFLIRHPKGTLLWDTGLGDAIADEPGGRKDLGNGIVLQVSLKLVDQLKELGLTPADVNEVAFSHFHFDHTGNAALFARATWIINRAELAYAQRDPVPFGIDPGIAASAAKVKARLIDGDEDVFGDGSVRILKTPGHTPGHQSLLVRLKRTGTVLLTGDLYHLRGNRAHRLVPTFNVERADTLASIDRFERIARNSHARVVIQHDPQDFAALPKPPAALD